MNTSRFSYFSFLHKVFVICHPHLHFHYSYFRFRNFAFLLDPVVLLPVLYIMIPQYFNLFFPESVIYPPTSVFTENYAKPDSTHKKRQNVRIVFYNLENLYDPHTDSLKQDKEFTSGGLKHWTFTRYFMKLNHVAKTFMAIGGWEPPAIIGICEVENRYVMNSMIFNTPLKKYKYKFIHYDSPDSRGIDVAMLYRPCIFRVLCSKNIRIQIPSDTSWHTRDILYVKGILLGNDTVHFFVNHWPSRLGGFTESVPKRKTVAQALRFALDTLQRKQHFPQVIIMGDFNDDPDQPAISEVLRAVNFSTSTKSDSLVNMMLSLMYDVTIGTEKYQGKWSILDQFIVSGNLLLGKGNLRTKLDAVHIFQSPFLMEEDDRYLGAKPFRTYSGPRYTGGFSDHLPVYMDVWSE
jgi:hypothetical protein